MSTIKFYLSKESHKKEDLEKYSCLLHALINLNLFPCLLSLFRLSRKEAINRGSLNQYTNTNLIFSVHCKGDVFQFRRKRPY